MKLFKTLLLLGILGVVTAIGVIYSGIYPIGADVPHNNLTYWILEQARERSIGRASADIEVPDLESPDLLLSGGSDYNGMCVSCHLKPGKENSDMRIGMYPMPPNLSLEEHKDEHGEDDDVNTEAQRTFWTIKHGIKASGMPAWGKTHGDDQIWGMVAFLRKMPEMTQDQYQVITSKTNNKASSEMEEH